MGVRLARDVVRPVLGLQGSPLVSDLHVVTVPQLDPRLGRQVVHDPRSRRFRAPFTVDTSTWRTRSIRLYDPPVNPRQIRGNCTGCDKAMNANAVGTRVAGTVWGMAAADSIYSGATTLDPFPGTWPPDDTGSSGLAACKAAQNFGMLGEYRWLFGGADEVVQAVMDGWTVGVGTWWTEGMFHPQPANSGTLRVIHATGRRQGGHQYRVRGYVEPLDAVVLRCWWGPEFRDVLLPRAELDDLLHDDGDAHVQTLPV